MRQFHAHAIAEEFIHWHVGAYDYIFIELADKAANMGAALNQLRAWIDSFIGKIDAKAWLIQVRMVAVGVAASEVCNENRTKAARERRAILRQTVDAF